MAQKDFVVVVAFNAIPPRLSRSASIVVSKLADASYQIISKSDI
jgi:hypothetical protein